MEWSGLGFYLLRLPHLVYTSLLFFIYFVPVFVFSLFVVFVFLFFVPSLIACSLVFYIFLFLVFSLLLVGCDHGTSNCLKRQIDTIEVDNVLDVSIA